MEAVYPINVINQIRASCSDKIDKLTKKMKAFTKEVNDSVSNTRDELKVHREEYNISQADAVKTNMESNKLIKAHRGGKKYSRAGEISPRGKKNKR